MRLDNIKNIWIRRAVMCISVPLCFIAILLLEAAQAIAYWDYDMMDFFAGVKWCWNYRR